ncbi:MAG TPA: hypothetical protein VFQ95_04830 [Rhodanobacteraceae bacterium]|nr:hypothetical protein [Rhodanobacteraceae bacterium]
MSSHQLTKYHQVAQEIASQADDSQKLVLRNWIEQLLAIKNFDLSKVEKAKRAIAVTTKSDFVAATAKVVARTAMPSELRSLSSELQAIYSSNLSVASKTKEAAALLAKSLKALAWDNRGLAAPLTLAGALVGVVFFGGQGAGIAALGSAIGVPLWVVFGAGGAFLGVLYEEVAGREPNAEATYRVIEAQREDKP